MPGDPANEVVVIRLGPGQRSWTNAIPWFYLAALLLIFAITRPFGVAAAIVGVMDAIGWWRLQRLRLTPTGLRVGRGILGASVRWSEVAALTTAVVRSRRGVGLGVDAVAFGAAPRHPILRVVVEPDAEPTIRRYLDDQGLAIPIDPPEPWQDRRGGWHAAELATDPYETIRSIQQAWLGPWLVRIDHGSARRARAMVIDRRDGEIVNRAPWRGNIAAAIADAERFIAAARRDLDAADPTAA